MVSAIKYTLTIIYPNVNRRAKGGKWAYRAGGYQFHILEEILEEILVFFCLYINVPSCTIIHENEKSVQNLNELVGVTRWA